MKASPNACPRKRVTPKIIDSPSTFFTQRKRDFLFVFYGRPEDKNLEKRIMPSGGFILASFAIPLSLLSQKG